MNTDNGSCVIRVYDDPEISSLALEDNLIIDRVNIGLELNPDGSANTTWIKERVKDKVFYNRNYKPITYSNTISFNVIGD